MLSVIIPVYNEELSVKDIIVRTLASISEADEVIVVDDGSTDKSLELARSVRAPNLHVITHERNRGNGASIITGAKHARGEWVATIDADETYFPENIPELFSKLQSEGAEMIVGSRRTLKDGPLLHRMAREVLRRWCQLLTGVRISDINSGLRILRKQRLLKYEALYPERFSLHIVLSVCCGMDDVHTLYLSVPYGLRTGTSKLSLGLLGVGKLF